MRKTFITTLFCLIAGAIFAQNSYVEIVRSTIKTEKKALIAEVMQLSDEEGALFWPLYNEYEEKLYAVNTKRFEMIKSFADNFENMSDEVATQIMIDANKIDAEKIKLEKTYFKKMMKQLSPQKTLKFFQASNKIEVMIDAQLAAEIPLLEGIE